MYTDGITEAMNSESKLFGEERLMEITSKSGSRNVKDLIDQTLEGVSVFVDGTEQSDDITLLVLQYKECSSNKNK